MTHDPSASAYGPTPTHLPPPDWYPDPAGSPQERYWDGTGWTGNLRDRVDTPPIPTPATPTAATPQAANPWQSAPANQAGYQGQQPWSGSGYLPGQTPNASYPPGQQFPGGPVYQNQAAPPWSAQRQGLAGWWRRVFAYLLDMLIAGVIINLVMSPFSASANQAVQVLSDDVQNGSITTNSELWQVLNSTGLLRWMILSVSVSIILRAVYFAVQWRLSGSSIGQRILSVKVVSASDPAAQLSWKQAIIRAFTLEILFAIPLVGIIAAFIPLGSKMRQGLHDMAARTLVVSK